MKRAAEWFLYLHDNTIEDAYRQIPVEAEETINPSAEEDESDEIPELYSTALTEEEGLWSRSGWAGRS